MSARQDRRPARTSKVSLVLAAGASAAVGTSAVVGHRLTAPEVVGAFAVVGTVGALSARSSRPHARPHVLTPLSEDSGEALTVAAPRAQSLVAQPAASHSDAA
jgi:hypothetical protein